ncbi:MAG: glycosyltransferase family 9 protein [Chloroflexi bacterium]|nr:glycosyltransferase family 9 protein [Chloroflexota bacterium]
MTARESARRILLRAWAALGRPLSPARAAPLPSSPRILIIRPDHLGDLLFAAPAVRLLRAMFPTAHLAALVGPWGAEIARRCYPVDEVRTCVFPGFSRQPKGKPWAAYRLLAHEARSLRDFDLAVVLRFDHWWGALLAHTAGIPRRWGDDIPECAPFLTSAAPYTAGRHEVEQSLRLVSTCAEMAGLEAPRIDTHLAFPVTADEAGWAAGYLAQQGLAGGERLIAIHPGAGAAVKLWPAARYAQVADALAERWQARVLLTGSRDELGLAQAVAGAMRSRATVAAGETTLGQLAALLARCQLVIGSDSGPLHLAVAVGAPTLHMFGPADPALFGPWAPGEEARHPVLLSPRHCVPCNRLDYGPAELPEHPCMAEVATEDVLRAAERVLAAEARP